MAKDAIRCFLETGEPIPKDIDPATERLEVTLV
jgi:hypothetical protein